MVRFKNRYLLVQIHFPPIISDNKDQLRKRLQLTERQLAQEIRRLIQDLYGDVGAGHTAQSMQVKYYNARTGLGILRTSRATYQLVWHCLTLMHGSICDGLAIERVQCVHLSGTIRNCQLKAIDHNYAELQQIFGQIIQQDNNNDDNILIENGEDDV